MYGHRRGRSWSRIGHGLYLAGGSATLADQLQAWSLVLPARAAFTHLTAAELLGWWLPCPVSHPVFAVTRRGEQHPQRRELHVRRSVDWPVARVCSGVRVVPAAEIMLACARDLALLDLVQLGDSALRTNACTVAELSEVAAHRRAGSVQLRRLVPLLDKRSESPWESVMRLLHQAADIPVEPQRTFFTPGGRFVARADLWVTGTRQIHEYDGEVHRDRGVHRNDLRRDRALAGIGVTRLGYTSTEVLREGGDIIAAADRVLGRSWDPARLLRWNGLIHDSLWGRAGQNRVRIRWCGKSAG